MFPNALWSRALQVMCARSTGIRRHLRLAEKPHINHGATSLSCLSAVLLACQAMIKIAQARLLIEDAESSDSDVLSCAPNASDLKISAIMGLKAEAKQRFETTTHVPPTAAANPSLASLACEERRPSATNSTYPAQIVCPAKGLPDKETATTENKHFEHIDPRITFPANHLERADRGGDRRNGSLDDERGVIDVESGFILPETADAPSGREAARCPASTNTEREHDHSEDGARDAVAMTADAVAIVLNEVDERPNPGRSNDLKGADGKRSVVEDANSSTATANATANVVGCNAAVSANVVVKSWIREALSAVAEAVAESTVRALRGRVVSFPAGNVNSAAGCERVSERIKVDSMSASAGAGKAAAKDNTCISSDNRNTIDAVEFPAVDSLRDKIAGRQQAAEGLVEGNNNTGIERDTYKLIQRTGKTGSPPRDAPSENVPSVTPRSDPGTGKTVTIPHEVVSDTDKIGSGRTANPGSSDSATMTAAHEYRNCGRQDHGVGPVASRTPRGEPTASKELPSQCAGITRASDQKWKALAARDVGFRRRDGGEARGGAENVIPSDKAAKRPISDIENATSFATENTWSR